jgi:aryl-alcohol dehydrogenase-like predicted oxidoreductase
MVRSARNFSAVMQKIILGTVQLGIDYGINNLTGKPGAEEAYNILQVAWDNGLRVLDTADAYGEAQRIIGHYHKQTGNHFVVNSKFKSNRLSIEEQLDKILDELGIKTLNIYFYHDFQDFTNSPDLLTDLNNLRKKGKFKKIGLSVYDKSEMELAINTPAIDVIQLPFNLFDNINERGRLLVKAKENKKTVQIRSVYLQGLFFKSPETLPPKLVPLKNYLVKINEIAQQLHLSIEELAIGYVVQQPLIDEIIIGVENVRQLKNNIELFSNHYSPALIGEVNKIEIAEQQLLYPKNWN